MRAWCARAFVCAFEHACMTVLVLSVSFLSNVHAGLLACVQPQLRTGVCLCVRTCVRECSRHVVCVTYLLHCTVALLIVHDSKYLKASSQSNRRTTRVCVCICMCLYVCMSVYMCVCMCVSMCVRAIEPLSPGGHQPTCTEPGTESL